MEQNRSTSLRVSNKKLLPRDISESLGKLPPQALELEEAVLGALMLEKSALNAVVEFLKARTFLFRGTIKKSTTSIVQLFKDSEPVDMRTVVNQLRKDGKIELVGGAYYIAELTSKVSSAANIEYHARIMIEMAIKRELILISSQVQQDAYEDTTDVFELLDKTEQSIFAISDSTCARTTITCVTSCIVLSRNFRN